MRFHSRGGATTPTCSTGCLIKTTEGRSWNGYLIRTLAASATRRRDTMETITPGYLRSKTCVSLKRKDQSYRLPKVFHLLKIHCSHFPSCFSPPSCCRRLIVVPSNRQVLQQNGPADGDFLSTLLTEGGDSVSGSPVWSPSPSDSGISEDPASDQMDSPQRPDSPSGDAQCFSSGPKSEAALGAGSCIDLRESHSRKQQQKATTSVAVVAHLRRSKAFLSVKRKKVSSRVQASGKLFNISGFRFIQI